MPRAHGSHGRSRRLAVRALPLLLLGTLLGIVTPEGSGNAAPTDTAAPGRVAFYGTQHRSLGTVALGAGSATASVPLFPGPQHYDDDASAQGDAVVWTSLRDSAEAQVFIQRGDGPVIRVTTGATGVQHPRLSPDGKQVAFAATTGRTDGQHDIWVARVEDGRTSRITHSGDNTWPAWSADGGQLAFSARLGDASSYQLFTAPAAGGGGPVRQLTTAEDCADGPGATEPAWSPTGAGTLVYTCEGRPGGYPAEDGTHLVLRSPNGAQSPALPANWQGREGSWSADGTSLAFITHGEPGNNDWRDLVYTASAGGAAAPVLRLTENREVSGPSWYTPAGGDTELLVARDSAEASRDPELSDMLPDGSDPRDLGLSAAAPASNNGWTGRGPVYSPDGRRIAFARIERVSSDEFKPRIWIANADGSAARPLRTLSPADPRETSPAWSPDGRRIAVVRDGYVADRHRIWISVIDVASGQEVFGVDQAAGELDLDPSFAPDGRTLLFTRITEGNNENERDWTAIWSVRAFDGGGATDLTAVSVPDKNERRDAAPALSPDGSTIAFVSAEGVWLMDADGTDRRPLPDGTSDRTAPAWSPDGSRIAFTGRYLEQRRINTVDLATGTRTVLLPLGYSGSRADGGFQESPAWQPTADLDTSPLSLPGELKPGDRTTVTVAVRNLGPVAEPAARLVVSVPAGLRLTAMEPGPDPSTGSCDVARFTCDLGALTVAAQVPVTLHLTAVAEGSALLVWTVSGSVQDPDTADNHATAQLTVGAAPTPPPTPPPAPPAAPPVLTVVATPGTGTGTAYVGGAVTVTYTVTNPGRRAVEGLSLAAVLPETFTVSGLPDACRTAAGCALAALPPGGSAVVQAVLTLTAAGRYRLGASVSATSRPAAGGAVRAHTDLAVRQPVITAGPPVGRPGTVTLVRGTDFPPGLPVRLAWNPGITAAANPAVPGADGTFVAQMLILKGDSTGHRTVTASGTGFGPVTAPFLVTRDQLLPPLWQAVTDGGRPAGTSAGAPVGTPVGANPGAGAAPVRPSSGGRRP
ncbi:DUF11 domain-containing protein [Streptomyces graminilatus]|uniref:DUF11 domain-containing protein n=1 Tax=Streptomyces graminilatus TaxID=1464070 RepID=UPI0006E41A4B|nr:DUF11 domain-containing protein [Streptomyces graminilatus]